MKKFSFNPATFSRQFAAEFVKLQTPMDRETSGLFVKLLLMSHEPRDKVEEVFADLRGRSFKNELRTLSHRSRSMTSSPQ